MLKSWRQADHADLDMPANKIVELRVTPAICHVPNINLRDSLEQLHGEIQRAPGPPTNHSSAHRVAPGPSQQAQLGLRRGATNGPQSQLVSLRQGRSV